MARNIIITEEQAQQIATQTEMTEYKFNSNIRAFLHDLLVDPVNAKPSDTLRFYGLTRSKLLRMLTKSGMVVSDQKIVDKDDEGNPCTAVMRVKYNVPRAGFERKLKKLYIRLFEKNVPERVVSEDGGTGCAASSGSFEAPMGDVQRRNFLGEDNVDEATATSTVGDYQYTVPMSTKSKTDPSLGRGKGIGGSTSIELMDEEDDFEF